MKRRIRLTESDLHKVINPSVLKISSELTTQVQERLNNGESPENIFDCIYDFSENNGIARVELNDKCNFINMEGKLLSLDLWFDEVYLFKNKFAKVLLRNKYINGCSCNWIDREGNFLSPDLWFNEVSSFNEGFARVYIKGKGFNFINTDGKILRPDLWFVDVNNFSEGLASVELNNREWFDIDTNGILYDMNGNRVDIPVQESKKYNSKRNVIRLTENDLHRVIKESIKKVLNEYN